MVTIASLLERADRWIVDRPRAVIVAFLVLSLVFAGGLGSVSTEAGTSQFVEGIPAQEASEDISEQFTGSPFDDSGGSTQLIQRGENVLSKVELIRMLTLQERLQSRTDLRVSSTSSAASIVATHLDPSATTLSAQRRAIRGASPSQIDAAVERAAANTGFTSLLSDDFNAEAASASATIGVVSHRVPGRQSGPSMGSSGDSPMTAIQQEAAHIAASSPGDITVFGSGITSAEMSSVIGDSLLIVVPLAALLILLFLVYAYRDPIDLLLGVVALVMAVVWTFGFMGLAGIPFGQMTIAVPVLLLAVGIDFGIHAINRYREERVTGKGVREAMRPTTDQLLVAFTIVTGTTVFGFGANAISDLAPIRDFGIAAAIGIVFTFLIFGVFLPAAKVELDTLRERLSIPEFGSKPLGDEGSLLGRALTVGTVISKRAPRVFLAVIVLTTVLAGGYGAGVDTSFSTEDFLPPEELPAYVTALPEPFAPGEYSVTTTINYLEDNFESTQDSTVSIYIEGPLSQDDALEAIHRRSQDPPDSFVTTGREAHPESIITVIESYAAANPKFAALVARNDLNGNGIPDDNLDRIYAALLDSPYRTQALEYITEDYRATRLVFSTESGATQSEVTRDARQLAERYRFEATATGQTVVFEAVTDIIFDSAIQSLVIALVASVLFLLAIYWVIAGRPSLGIVNLIPIVVAVAYLTATMRFLGIPLNALTATVLSIAIGLGIDYSAHLVHRFAEEYEASGDLYGAMDDTVRGTGGALAGSMLTTTTGTAVLSLAITPILGQFGMVIALSVFYSFVASIIVTPSVAVVWEQARSLLGSDESSPTASL